MKVPDKIYLVKDAANPEGIFDTVASKKPMFQDDICYIHKDALLEWAKEVNDSGPIKDSADKGDAWSIGYLCGMRDIIDKLNSL